PLHPAIVELTRVGHVAEVLVAGDRSFAERAVFDRALERVAAARLHACGDEISHTAILRPMALPLQETRMIKKEVSVPRVILGFAIVLAMAGSGASSAMQAQPAAPGAQQMQTQQPVPPSAPSAL